MQKEEEMNLRQAAQQALEALEVATTPLAKDRQEVLSAKEALRTALAEPEQETVAWAEEIISDLNALHDSDLIREIDSGDALIRLESAIAAVEEAAERHTHPPQRKPLTDEEIVDIWADVSIDYDDQINIIEMARAIERAHGIGGEK